MNQTQAEGILIAFAINQLLGTDTDPDFPGCCIVHCGPCTALHWLRYNNNVLTNAAVQAAYPGCGWDWQFEDGSINWAKLQERWDAHKGCSSSNGVHEPCVPTGEE